MTQRQTPEALAAECKRLAESYAGACVYGITVTGDELVPDVQQVALYEAIDRLAELAAAHTEDAARLDFLEKRAKCEPKMDGQHVWWPTNFKHALKGANLRAAIDGARKEQA